MTEITAFQHGLEITDANAKNGVRFEVHTPSSVTARPVDPDRFAPVPVSTAASIETESIEFPTNAIFYLRDAESFTQIADTSAHTDTTVQRGDYIVELSNAPMKLYLYVEDTAIDIAYRTTSVRVSFSSDTEVVVGARSFHDQPAGTITTTDSPCDVMQAVSLLSSSLQDVSPERSFPTLRGQPPLVEVGDRFDAPDGIERPNTGVRLELPAEFEYIYPAVSLAYYLGAEVVAGDTPRLVTDSGFVYDLDGDLGYEETVSRVLRQVFFFDCVTRTEGLYDVALHERERVASHVDFDFEALYHATVGEQVTRYLSVPYPVVEDILPAWPLTMDIEPVASNASMLPWAASELAVVRCPDTATTTTSECAESEGESSEMAALNELRRGGGVPAGAFTRSATLEDISETDIITPRDTDSLEYAWVGDGFPLGANKALPDAWHQRAVRETPEQATLSVAVVVNDSQMNDERNVEDVYQRRDLPAVDVAFHDLLSVAELRDVIRSDVDFLHFVGHVDEAGLRCRDGHLDARTLDSEDVGVRSFLLNSCRSFAQGRALVDAGSSAGVVTLAEVANSRGTQVGRALARLLSCGFTLQWSVMFAQRHVTGYSYVTVGDGRVTLVQSESGCPIVAVVEPDGDGWLLELRTVGAGDYSIGSLFSPTVADGTQYLTSGTVDTFRVSDEELDQYFALETMPVVVEPDSAESELKWSDAVTSSDLRAVY